ncbi:MAG: CrcB family protein [Wenzhouxiangellaceae bacterium]|nr:CrcB family protein [Wenzhouxiangellaceae bacterium]
MLSRAPLYLFIALAAALGGSLRYGVSVAWLQTMGAGWPWPTLIVNLLGSLLIAVYWRLAGPQGRFAASIGRRTAVMTGFCGGLTTFSAFGLETLLLLEGGRALQAAAYVGASGFGSLVVAWLALNAWTAPSRPANDVS